MALGLVWQAGQAWGVPASPQGQEVVQPDGTRFVLHLRGDEFFSWHETADGYAVVRDAADGFWKYARPAPDRADFLPVPEARVGAVDPESLGLAKHARPDPERLRAHIADRQRQMQGEPEELPVPGMTTDGNQ